MSFAHFTLAVRDVERSARFFAAALGWRRIERPGNNPVPSAWLEIAPGQEAHLVEAEGFEPSPFEDEFGRHIALSHPLADFPRLKSRLAENGAELVAPRRPTPFERFFFRSPDGYLFEVIDRDRPRSG